MEHQRKYRRHTLPKPIQVFDVINNDLIGTLVNISQDGLLIAGSKGLKLDSIYQIILRLPEPFAGCSMLTLGVDCLWVDKASSAGQLYWSGCHIIDISEADQQHLCNILSLLDESNAVTG